DDAGLTPFLDRLGFNLVGYGCTTCIAEGTPVLQGDGTAVAIEALSLEGGAPLYAPAPDGGFAVGTASARFKEGLRECVTLAFQDGRALVCTPDHLVLRSDGRWLRADELVAGRDRVVAGLDAPLDAAAPDEGRYVLPAAGLDLSMSSRDGRARTLAFARILGHLLGDGSISALGQARVNVGQALDREAVLRDVELVTGRRPAGIRYDERKWSIVLPAALSAAIRSLPGVRTSSRIAQAPCLPAFLLDGACPVAVVREFLGGMFGADGHAPVLKRQGPRAEDAVLQHPAYSQNVRSEHAAAQRSLMHQIVGLLERCGVQVEGYRIHEFPVRKSASSHRSEDRGAEREIRLCLPDGLSFVERIGFRYCVDKALRASAAAVYWRTVATIGRQRLWMADRITALHKARPELSFRQARAFAAGELGEREAISYPHYATLAGHDRFDRLPRSDARRFQPLHRDACGFPSPVDVLTQIGARDWFAPLHPRESARHAKRYALAKESRVLPALAIGVIDRRPAGERTVFDLTVPDLNAFVAGTIGVHNCIGNSGPLASPEVEAAVQERDLNVVAVLSGNRNFEGRVHPLARSAYLASPPLVVAYALAGTVLKDLTQDPVGTGKDGTPVYLRDIWPTNEEVAAVVATNIKREQYDTEYARIFRGDDRWQKMAAPTGPLYEWDPESTYVQEPPYFSAMSAQPAPVRDIANARALVIVGDSITTDHISPAGSFSDKSPAGQYLLARGVQRVDFNQYGTRRGSHDVLMRGTFGNIRLRNAMVDREGNWTRHMPDREEMSVFDAAMRYRGEGVPLIVLAGKEYGSGSSRDWAAKGPALLGVRAVIAESYERIHRSNLVGMGVIPLEFQPGESAKTLGLTGDESYSIAGLSAGVQPKQTLKVRAEKPDGTVVEFTVRSRIDNATDVEYVRHGGVLPMVVRQLLH
ncbi:MAG: hypothetical protein FJ034_01345, partial [Chloroflexi bacterium]|nr:hypothetical protein [Chloroflexota bacterium]